MRPSAIIPEVKTGEEPGYYVACTKCPNGAIPMWFNSESHEAVGSCVMCGNIVRIKLIPPGHVISYTAGVGESIVPKK